MMNFTKYISKNHVLYSMSPQSHRAFLRTLIQIYRTMLKNWHKTTYIIMVIIVILFSFNKIRNTTKTNSHKDIT